MVGENIALGWSDLYRTYVDAARLLVLRPRPVDFGHLAHSPEANSEVADHRRSLDRLVYFGVSIRIAESMASIRDADARSKTCHHRRLRNGWDGWK